ncbi:MAG: hypothetical protein DRP75_03230 [Candidatus Omnitrophota bacterium]|nr:MAG: hypothetical protein DRP75_03230 [Candidatus Omnitrophota bacterium]
MMHLSIKKRIRYLLARVVLKFACLIAFLPSRVAFGLADVIGRLAYLLIRKKRQIALDNLRLAFGKEKKEEELKEIACLNAREICRAGVEILQFLYFPSRIKIIIEGKENIEKAFLQKRGVILIGAHFGNFPLIIAKLREEGYRINTLMREMHDRKVERFFQGIRERLRISSIMLHPKQISIKKCLEVLRNNEAIFILIDQHAGAGGVKVDFFGTPALTPIGPAIFALRTGAPILPVFILKERDRHRIVIEPEVKICAGKDEEERIEKTMGKLTKIVEAYVRRYPHQWSWVHKRWKGVFDQNSARQRNRGSERRF